MTGRNYPPRNVASGDCPVCDKYQSRSKIIWRGLAFCCKEHMRKYMMTILVEESDETMDTMEGLVGYKYDN